MEPHDECLVCLEVPERKAAVWQCRGCFTLLHLLCVQQYARSAMAPAHKLLASIINAPLFWYCPHCRKQYGEANYPTQYNCFCEKEVNPPDDPYLPPHSCSSTCGRPLGACGHTCTERCHAGPCQKCAQTVEQECFCGKQVARVRCGAVQLSCGAKCGRTGVARLGVAAQGAGGGTTLCAHPCTAVCHAGPCPPCLLPVLGAPCVCGGSKKTLPCSKRVWQCPTTCGRPLACGRHTCSTVCHAGPCPPCPTMADGPRRCPCGKVPYPSLTCTDPAPRCGDTCDRSLPCGHTCMALCHEGTCEPCTVRIEGPCRCGKSRVKGKCSDGEAILLCAQKCTRTRACGRHACKRRCCEGGLACPPCREACGRTLACGKHTCEAYCHTGPCQPCPRTSTLTCACGGTVVSVPCGSEGRVGSVACMLRCRKETPPCGHKYRHAHACHAGPCPPCTAQCGKLHERCGHPCLLPCHTSAPTLTLSSPAPQPLGGKKVNVDSAAAAGPTPCPPCTASVTRVCVGKHESRVQPCAAPALFKCALPCGRALPCTKHVCEKACHAGAPESCGDCPRSCGEPRPAGCVHACPLPSCHPGPCPLCTVVTRQPCHCALTTLTYTCTQLQGLQATDWRSCGKRCRRTLRCGHACPGDCHAGSCAEVPGLACSKSIVARCPCGNRKEDMACVQAVRLRREAGVADDASSFPLLPCSLTGPCSVHASSLAADRQNGAQGAQGAAVVGPPDKTAEEKAEEARVAAEEARALALRRKREKEAARAEAGSAAATAEQAKAEEVRAKARQARQEAERAFYIQAVIAVSIVVTVLAVLAGAALL